MSTRRLKILFVLVPAFHPNDGGVQMSTFKLSRYFADNGHRVSVFSFSAGGHLASDAVRVYHPVDEGSAVNEGTLGALVRAIRSEEPDVVINQMPYEQAISRVLKSEKTYLLLGCLRNTLYSVRANLDQYVRNVAPTFLKRFSTSSVVQYAFLQIHRRRHKYELQLILKSYDFFIMFGPPNLDELRFFVPDFNLAKVRLIPNSIPHVRDEVPVKEKRLLWLGRVERGQKRADLIIPIWRALSEKLPDWELDVVGDGPLLGELISEARRSGLRRISFHGRQQPDSFYSSAAVFFMTSAFEGFPNTLVEAQSFGCVPVIFDSYPMAKWILPESSGGVLVSPFDTSAMIDCLYSLASDNSVREAAARQSLENARRFVIKRVGEQWEAFLNESLSAVAGHPAAQ